MLFWVRLVCILVSCHSVTRSTLYRTSSTIFELKQPKYQRQTLAKKDKIIGSRLPSPLITADWIFKQFIWIIKGLLGKRQRWSCILDIATADREASRIWFFKKDGKKLKSRLSSLLLYGLKVSKLFTRKTQIHWWIQ